MKNPAPHPTPAANPSAPRSPYTRPTLEPLGRWSARTLQVTGMVMSPADIITRNHA